MRRHVDRHAVLLEVVMVLVISLAGWKYTYHLDANADIILSDPTGYLERGLDMHDHGMPSASGAPLYTLWFNLLSKITDTPMQLYYREYKLLTMALPLALYVCMHASLPD